MRTFEFSDAKSHKFWNIEVSGTSFTVTYGKIGTAGQNQTKSWPTAEKAQAEADKLIKEKTGKGYHETTPKASTSEDDALIKAILANPTDRTVHSAYADFLIERGEPIGEFMQVQMALEDESLPAAARKKLKDRETALLKANQKNWVGNWVKDATKARLEYEKDLGPHGEEVIHYEKGLLRGIAVGELKMETARGILKDDKLKFVNSLFIGDIPYDESEDGDVEIDGPDIPEDVESHHSMYVLVRWPQLKHIRHFYWGWFPTEPEKGSDYYYNCHMDGSHVYDYIKQMPEIETLRVCAHVRDAKKIVALNMPNLKFFQLYHGWDFPLDKLAANKSVTNLETILCHPHVQEHGEDPYIRTKHMKAIAHSPYLKKLKHLRLRSSDIGDAGIKELVNSDLLTHLKVLELQLGCISDAGAKLLSESPHIKNLELLDLSQNALTKDGIKLLQATGVNLVADMMHETTSYDEDGENEYLWHGDAE